MSGTRPTISPPATQPRPLPEVAGVEHRFVEVGGGRIHVAEAGAGEPLLMLHGFPQHWYEWRKLIGPLAEHYRVLCPDLPGFGWSDPPAGGYGKESLADDMAALMDALGLERAGLVGHDWGGWIGFLLCLRHPQRVSRYLALNIYHPFIGPSLRATGSLWRFWYQAVIASPWLGRRAVARAGSRSGVLRWIAAGPEAWTDEDLAEFTGQFSDPVRADAAVQLYRTFLLHEMRGVIAGRYRRMRLQTPTLLLFGTGDKVQQARNLEGYQRYADDMRVELVPGTGHFIADERPELVLERALDFFGEG